MKIISESKYAIFWFLLFYVTISPILDTILTLKFLGISFFILVIPISLILILILKNTEIFKIEIKGYFLILLLLLSISFIRYLSYDESIINNLIQNNFILLFPLYFILFKHLNFNESSKKTINIILISILVIQTLNSLFYLLNLPCININYEDIIDVDNFDIRFRGILGGSNTQSNFIALIVMILILGNSKKGLLFLFCISTLGLVCIIPCGSRGPILFLLIILVIAFLKNQNVNIISKIIVLILFIFILSFIYNLLVKSFPFIDNVISNFTGRAQNFVVEGDETRNEKYKIGYDIITSNFSYIIIGSPTKLQNKGLVTFSDNGFLHLILSSGLILNVILLIYITNISKLFVKSIIANYKIILYITIVCLMLFLNNAVLWFAWTFYLAFGYWYIYRDIQSDIAKT